MDDDTATHVDAFRSMAREFPVRTCIFTFGLPLFALLQLINGAVYGGSVPIIAAFLALTVVCSALVTQYQVAVYRRRQVEVEA